ncbi:MAG: EI24 domain-containing protein, partial [Bdellovibrionales bacterium]|nr:EI24 domain-containing protein [Bdellovibrionales bacterium]
MQKKNEFNVYQSFQQAFISLFDRKILFRIIFPFIVAGVIGLGIIIYAWSSGTGFFESFLRNLGWFSSVIAKFQEWLNISIFAFMAGLIFLFILFIFFYFVILVLTSVFLVPLIVPAIEEKYYPELKLQRKSPKDKISILRSLSVSVWVMAIYIFWFTLTLPFFLIPGAHVLISFFLNSYLVKALFPMDCLSEHLSYSDFKKFSSQHSSELWQLAFLNNALLFIPVVNLMAPPIVALSYAIY